MVGSSDLSGRAIIFKHLAPFRKIESSHKNKNIKVVIGGLGTIVGSVVTQVGLLIGQRSWAIHRRQRVNTGAVCTADSTFEFVSSVLNQIPN